MEIVATNVVVSGLTELQHRFLVQKDENHPPQKKKKFTQFSHCQAPFKLEFQLSKI